jgi:hypothetical protein
MKVQNAIFSFVPFLPAIGMNTMTRVTFLIDRGEDSESYATRTFLPLLRALADVRRLEAARVLAAATAQLAARIIIDVYFDDDARMNESFASAEGRRVSREIINAAGAGIEMITADVLDVGTD